MKTYSLWALLQLMIALPALSQLTYATLEVEYDSAWTFRNLQIVPLRYKSGNGIGAADAVLGNRAMSLAEAMLKKKVKVQEMPNGGADANWLKVTNRSKQDVVIQSGEILDGGKQDRMVGESKIISPGSTDYLHVFCVEKRRWADKPKKFKRAGVANSDLQKTMNLKKRQSEVWKEIDRQFNEQEKKTETYSYLELYENAVKEDSDYLQFFLQQYGETDSLFAGYLFITGNHIISTEVFATAELTRIAFINLLTSNIQTARSTGSPPRVSRARQEKFMDKVLLNETDQKIYVTAHGKLQISNGKVIHLIAYDD